MELSEDFNIPVNEFQTPITKQLLDSLPEEVAEQLLDYISTVPFIQNLISPTRRRTKDMPRDAEGKIIVDLSNPHILEDMDYFRPMALFYKEHGCYTYLIPNKNPNSEYYRWYHEEKRRCRDGYVRESDGEWIPGYLYFFLNYCPMLVLVIDEESEEEDSGRGDRIKDFPFVFEGLYWRAHYLYQARQRGKHAVELAKRGAGKSFYLAGMLAHNLIFGESSKKTTELTSILTACTNEYLGDKDGTLSKLEPMLTFLSEHTEFPRLKTGTLKQMFWQMKYVDKKGNIKGSLNSVMGVSSKDDVDKLRGKRGMFYFEEFGNFPGLLSIYQTVRKGLEEGKYAFGQAYMIGTANNKESNFASAKVLLYEPDIHRIYSLPNVFDKKAQGNDRFAFFFPAYINRAGCYNHDGVSDVIKALIEVLKERYQKKYSNDPTTLLTAIAEDPITPAEAIIRVKDAFFPVASLNERLRELNLQPNILDSVYIGKLVQERNGEVRFEPTSDVPIRSYGVENTSKGALEIYEMPQKGSDGKINPLRYVIGHDPVDNDQAESHSLSSTFVVDVFTDRIVAEYTGRQQFATDNYEIVRLLCIFYNAKCLYESNKKGIFAYFQMQQCTHLLATTPDYLREKQLVKYSAFGSNAYGVNANNAINNYANGLIRDWLNKKQTVTVKEDGEDVVREVPNLYFIKSKALLEELVGFDAFRNFDRVRALGMAMLYREERMILTGGNPALDANRRASKSYLGNDDFFSRNYGN
jgi:hypothetical protein